MHPVRESRCLPGKDSILMKLNGLQMAAGLKFSPWEIPASVTFSSVNADGSGKIEAPFDIGKMEDDRPHWSADGRTLYFYSNEDGFPCPAMGGGFDQRGGAPSGPGMPSRLSQCGKIADPHFASLRGVRGDRPPGYCDV